jgi:hypothetical protein
MKNVSYFILLILIASCQKDIEITPKSKYQEQLFIEGILYPGEVPRIYLSRALPFFRPEVTPQEVFARGAKVVISNRGLQYTLLPDSTFDPFRCRWIPFYEGGPVSMQGETYTLMISYQGKNYSASTTINQKKVNILSVEYTEEFFDVYGGHDGVIITLQDIAGEVNHYRFQMNRMIDNERLHAHTLGDVRSDCTNGEMYPITDLGRTIFSDEKIDGQLLTMPIEVSFEYKEGDSTWVFMQSLDINTAKFYKSVDSQLESIYNPFVEPVFIDSQIDGALGVFGSAVRSDSVLFIYPQDNP